MPASAQWKAGVQKTLPWASVADVSYVGNHGYNRLGGFQSGTTVNLNAVDFGAAYLPQNQDLTRAGTEHGARRAARIRTTCCKAYQWSGQHHHEHHGFLGQYHSIQSSVNRRFRNGFCFGVNYVLSLSFTGNTGLTSGFSTPPTARSPSAPTRRSTRSRTKRSTVVRTRSRPTGCGACRKCPPAWEVSPDTSSMTGSSPACSRPVRPRPTTSGSATRTTVAA